MKNKRIEYINSISDIDVRQFKKISFISIVVIFLFFIFICFQVYIPINPLSGEIITYQVKQGASANKISKDLEELRLIRSDYFLKFYLAVSLKYHKLKAGKYNLSPKMSAYQIIKRISDGDTLKNNITIIEGWKTDNIAEYLESKEVCSEGEFIELANGDYRYQFDFLDDKPLNLDLEGYLFPDTYEIAEGDNCQNILGIMLSNFDKKITPELREEIKKQNKSIFEIITMASIIEKEVRTLEDKKTVSGVLWKRIGIGMALQVDATINYITGKSDPGVLIKDTQIESPYNTYKYPGLPKGPISNPGFDSIMAAIYPSENPYFYYLSNGKTYFSVTHDDHVTAKELYLR